MPEVLAVPETPAPPVFDEKVLLNLLEGDRESAAEIANQYLDDVGGQVAGLREAIQAGDFAVDQGAGASCSRARRRAWAREAMRYCAADIEKKAAGGALAEAEKSRRRRPNSSISSTSCRRWRRRRAD